MNGRPLPVDGREMRAFVAYLDMLTADAGSFGDPAEDPEPLPPAATPARPGARARALPRHLRRLSWRRRRGHANGQPGEPLGYLHPPLWGGGSFNAAAGMSRPVDGRPPSSTTTCRSAPTPAAPALTAQDAWDIAAFLDSQPRPPAPR